MNIWSWFLVQILLICIFPFKMQSQFGRTKMAHFKQLRIENAQPLTPCSLITADKVATPRLSEASPLGVLNVQRCTTLKIHPPCGLNSSSKLPVTALNEGPLRGAYSNLHRFKSFDIESLKRYVVACEFVYIKEGEPNYKQASQEMESVFGKDVHWTPIYQTGKEIVYGYLIRSKNEWIVAFRGTKKKRISEWINCLDSRLVWKKIGHHDVHVHNGLFKEYQLIQQDFMTKLKSLYKGGPITFIGHSKGGAISHLGIIDFLKMVDAENIPVDKIKVVTFGGIKTFSKDGYDGNSKDGCGDYEKNPVNTSPQNLFKQHRIKNVRVRFQSDLIAKYPFYKSFHHINDVEVVLRNNTFFEHSIRSYKSFICSIPSSLKSSS